MLNFSILLCKNKSQHCKQSSTQALILTQMGIAQGTKNTLFWPQQLTNHEFISTEISLYYIINMLLISLILHTWLFL